jgi:exonuclease 3'-5' domain-containing protein 1
MSLNMTTSTSNGTIISSVTELQTFLNSISSSDTIYLDLEGNRLSRHGTISIITLLIHPQNLVRLIDILVLREEAFTTSSNTGKSLKSIFEDSNIPKCIWDVRNDADALMSLYHVGLSGITDIQLLENASRTNDKTYVRGLDKCVQYDLKLGFMEIHRWIRTKKEVKELMSTDIFGTRPLNSKLVQYCTNDVIHLPTLHELYLKRIGKNWLEKAMLESKRRVEDAYSPAYDPHSERKKLGPWGSGTVNDIERFNDPFEAGEDMIYVQDWFELDDDNDVGYWDDDDGGGKCAADGAMDEEAFASCWDKGD